MDRFLLEMFPQQNELVVQEALRISNGDMNKAGSDPNFSDFGNTDRRPTSLKQDSPPKPSVTPQTPTPIYNPFTPHKREQSPTTVW
jgi:hypothetical protein